MATSSVITIICKCLGHKGRSYQIKTCVISASNVLVWAIGFTCINLHTDIKDDNIGAGYLKMVQSVSFSEFSSYNV